MALTPTERQIADLFIRYRRFSDRQAVQQALLTMRGDADYGAALDTPDDTDVMANGERVDLAQLETLLQREASERSQ